LQDFDDLLERIRAGDPEVTSRKLSACRPADMSVNTIFPWLGGKSRHADWIIKYMPLHILYVEAFGGTGAVLTSKTRSMAEVYADQNYDLVNFFQHIQHPFWIDHIIKELLNVNKWNHLTLDYYLRLLDKNIVSDLTNEHKKSELIAKIQEAKNNAQRLQTESANKKFYELVGRVASMSGSSSKIRPERGAAEKIKVKPISKSGKYEVNDYMMRTALATYVTQHLGKQGMGSYLNQTFNIENVKEPDMLAMSARIQQLKQYQERLSDVLVIKKDWRQTLSHFDSADTFFYLDPPYHPSCRKTQAGGDYAHEMTVKDHADMIDMLLDLEAMVILSGYDNEEYKRLVAAGWHVENKATTYKGKQRIETIWISPSAMKRQAVSN
jgi:site-specific DNA-adenine methylase